MCHLMCPLASILAEPSLLSDLLRVLRYAIPSPCPTYLELFQAATVISRYAEHVDDLVTCKLEAILASFGHQV